MERNFSSRPSDLRNDIYIVIEKYNNEKFSADKVRLCNLLYNMQLDLSLLAAQRAEYSAVFSNDQYDKDFTDLKFYINQIKMQLSNNIYDIQEYYDQNTHSSGLGKVGFGAMWLFGAATGVAIFGLIILGALYL